MPPVLQAIVSKLLAKKPEDRYQAPEDLATALAPLARAGGSSPPGPEAITPVPNPSALSGSPWAAATERAETPDTDPSPRPSYRAPTRRLPTKALAAATVGLFLLGGAIVVAVVSSGDSKAKPAAQAPAAAATPRRSRRAGRKRRRGPSR